MNKKIVSLVMALMLASVNTAFADETALPEAEVTESEAQTESVEAEAAETEIEAAEPDEENVEAEEPKAKVLTSEKFTLYVEVMQPEGEIIPSDLRFNLFTEDGVWLANRCRSISEAGTIAIEFEVPEYEIGSLFRVVATTGAEYVLHYTTQYQLNEEFVVETYAYSDFWGNVIVADEAHISVCPFYDPDAWGTNAEKLVNDRGIKSDTPYLIWISKANYTVSVFLNENGSWECINHFGCSIGAPGTPTIIGQYKYIEYLRKWDYGSYYVGPVMRFYNGYAIHSTLLNNDGTDRDGRIGHMISHGCIRVRPENMAWLTYYVPFNTKIYITNE